MVMNYLLLGLRELLLRALSEALEPRDSFGMVRGYGALIDAQHCRGITSFNQERLGILNSILELVEFCVVV